MIVSYEHFDLFGHVALERVKFEAPIKADASLHDEACFMHVIKGKSRLYAPKHQLKVDRTDSILMKCGSYLNSWVKNEDDAPNEAIFVHFFPEVIKHVYDDKIPDFLTDSNKKLVRPIEKIPTNTLIENYVESLLFYFNNQSIVTDELIKLKVKELLLLLINTDNSSHIISILQDMFRPEIYKFKEIIHANIFEDLKLEDLAILSGMSLSTFKRKFKSVFNTSPNQYIRRKRLNKSVDLLKNSDLTISEIAYDCGFNDLTYFSKSFAGEFHVSPSTFRKAYSYELHEPQNK